MFMERMMLPDIKKEKTIDEYLKISKVREKAEIKDALKWQEKEKWNTFLKEIN